jgi:hypothetical protein
MRKLPQTGWMGDIKRGAAMGRSDRHGFPDLAYKVSLQRVRLDSGGYDNAGAYWGIGKPLYWACGEAPGDTADKLGFEMFFRAADRDAAKAMVKERYPEARFYR